MKKMKEKKHEYMIWFILLIGIVIGIFVSPFILPQHEMKHEEEHDHSSSSTHAHKELTPIEWDVAFGEPTMELEIIEDPAGAGWNVHIITTNFVFAPQHASTEHIEGEGHAHLYVDEEKIARMYSPWFHIPSLDPGVHSITVELNANNHAPLLYTGQPLSRSVELVVE